MWEKIIALAIVVFSSSACLAGFEEDLVAAAKSQIGVTRIYDASYQRIDFPNGDVPLVRGVCTDVLVRAYRKLGIDLQLLVNDDINKARSAYPKTWGLRNPDPNIDHRRVPNLAVFFARHGRSLPPENRNPDAYGVGDIVVWRLHSGVPHIGLVAAERSSAGTPLVIHNIGAGTQLEDSLFEYTITGHYRYRGPQ